MMLDEVSFGTYHKNPREKEMVENDIGSLAVVVGAVSAIFGGQHFWAYWSERRKSKEALENKNADHEQTMEKNKLESEKEEASKAEALLKEQLKNLEERLQKHEERIMGLESERQLDKMTIAKLEKEIVLERMKVENLNKVLDMAEEILKKSDIEPQIIEMIKKMR